MAQYKNNTIRLPNYDHENHVCQTCNKNCIDAAIFCKNCKKFTHKKCSNLPNYQLQMYEHRQITYLCYNCVQSLYVEQKSGVAKREEINSQTIHSKQSEQRNKTTAENTEIKNKTETIKLVNQNSASALLDNSEHIFVPVKNRFTLLNDSEDMDLNVIKSTPIRRSINSFSGTVSEKSFSSCMSVNLTAQNHNMSNDSLIIPCGQQSNENKVQTPENNSELSLPPCTQLPISPITCAQKSPTQVPSTCNLTPLTSVQENITNLIRKYKRNSSNRFKEDRSKILCKFYERNACKHVATGEQCSFYHPIKCDKYVQFGPVAEQGCNLGENCNLFHPSLCDNSIKNLMCLNVYCRGIHLKGTKRKPSAQTNQQVEQSLQNDVTFLYNRVRMLEERIMQLETQYMQLYRITPPPIVSQHNLTAARVQQNHQY